MKDDLSMAAAKSVFRVKVEVPFASEVVKAEIAEMIAMRRISKGVGRGKMRRGNSDDRALSGYSMNFLHRGNNV